MSRFSLIISKQSYSPFFLNLVKKLNPKTHEKKYLLFAGLLQVLLISHNKNPNFTFLPALSPGDQVRHQQCQTLQKEKYLYIMVAFSLKIEYEGFFIYNKRLKVKSETSL